MSLLLLLVIATPGIDEASIGSFATRKATPLVNEVLKSPSTAVYGVKRVAPAEPSSIEAPGRYIVTGSVDSQNGFGAVIRNEWKASVLVGPSGTMDLLILGMTSESDPDKVTPLFVAPPEKRYRHEIYDGARKDLASFLAKMREPWKRYPVKKRDSFMKRDIRKFLTETSKKYSLGIDQLSEILGIPGS